MTLPLAMMGCMEPRKPSFSKWKSVRVVFITFNHKHLARAATESGDGLSKVLGEAKEFAFGVFSAVKDFTN